jgi:hypothetical protein
LYCAWTHDKASRDEAAQAAYISALAEAAKELGVTVMSDFELNEACHNEQCSMQVRNQETGQTIPVTFAGVTRIGLWEECYEQSGRTSCSARVVVGVPQTEIAWARRSIVGRATLVVECPVADDAVCAGAEETVRQSVTGARIPLAQDTFKSLDDARRLGETTDSKYVVYVRFRTQDLGKEGGACFSTAEVSAEVLETRRGSGIWATKLRPVKQGAYEEHGCFRTAAHKALQDVTKRLGYELQALDPQHLHNATQPRP